MQKDGVKNFRAILLYNNKLLLALILPPLPYGERAGKGATFLAVSLLLAQLYSETL